MKISPLPQLPMQQLSRRRAAPAVNSQAGIFRTQVYFLAATLCYACCSCASIRPSTLCRNDVIHARQMSQQGLDAVHRGRFEQAEACFIDAIKHCPTNTTARYQLANCLWKRGARHEAIQQLTEALHMSGRDDVEMVVELGYMHANVGNLEEAVRIAEQAMQRDPHDASVLKLHGDALHELGRHREALASFQKSLRYDPEDARVLLTTAEIYQLLDRPARVLSATNQAEDLIPQPHVPESLYVMQSTALQQLQRHDEAVEVLVTASQVRPLGPAGLTQLAEAQFGAGRLAEAEHTIARALEFAEGDTSEQLQRLRGRIASQTQSDHTVQR